MTVKLIPKNAHEMCVWFGTINVYGDCNCSQFELCEVISTILNLLLLSTRIGVIIDWTYCADAEAGIYLEFFFSLSWQNNNFKISKIEKLIYQILVCDP